jgi:hypothetical protein
MAIRVGLEHRTSYRFDRMVGLGPHVIRLRPAPHCRTPIISYSLDVSPEDHFLNWQQDPFGNYLARLVFPEKTDELTITVDLVADLTVINPFDFFVAEEAEHVPFDYEPLLKADLAPYLAPVPSGPLLDALVRSVRTTIPDGIHIVDYLVALNQRVMGEVEYTTRLEPGVQSPDETLEKALGSCRAGCWSRCYADSVSPPASCPATWCSSPRMNRPSTVRPARRRTSPTCTPGARCTCRGPAGSGSTRHRDSSPAKVTSRSAAHRTRRVRRR